MCALSLVPELPGDRPAPLVPSGAGSGRGRGWHRSVARDPRGVNGAEGPRRPRRGAALWGLSLAVAALTLALLLATEPRLAIVWDEGYTLGRQQRLRLWFQALADPPRFAATWRPPAVELVQQAGAQPPHARQIDGRLK